MSRIASWGRRLTLSALIGGATLIAAGCAGQPTEESSGVVVDYQGRPRTDPSPVAPFGEMRLRPLHSADLVGNGPMLVADSSASGKAHFVRLMRFSTEQQTWLTMDPDTAFTRDLYTGTAWFVQGAEDGDSWQVTFTMANGSVISSPELRFVDSLGSEQDCFISGLSRLCGGTGVFIESYFSSQCGATGSVKVAFIENSGTWGTDTFYIKNQIADSAVPVFNQNSYSDAYDNQCRLVGKDGFRACARDTTGALLSGYSTVSIGRLGCALTTASNRLVYAGLTVDPPALNTWLEANGGYTRGGGISWVKVGEYARAQLGTDIGSPTYYAVDGAPTAAQFDSARTFLATQICRYGLASVKVFHDGDRQHWVSAYGRTRDSASFLISDPNGGVRATLATRYSNEPYKVVFWRKSGASNPAHLGVQLNSPAHMVLTDPLGRRLGFDPASGTAYREIPDAAYSIEYISGDEPGDTEGTHPTKELLIPQPVAGTYVIQVVGTDTGVYSMDLAAQYQNDQSDEAHVPETPTWVGAVHSYSFTYSPTGGQAPVLDHGSFLGGGQSAEADGLITYSSPGVKSSTVPAGGLCPASCRNVIG